MVKATATLVCALIILAIVHEGFPSSSCSTPGRRNCNQDCYTHCDCVGGKEYNNGAGMVLCKTCTYPLGKKVGFCKFAP
uniref:Holocyclotoxin 3 n=1 Tax=Ixodes holocyclus TaxID=65647 RepID=A0A1B0T6N7_IXOHO|nr:holocyclotoxin 3 [Ixodes holocyclus]